jgi:hypothetical protein
VVIRRVVSSVEKKVTCRETALRAVVDQEEKAVSNAARKGTCQETALKVEVAVVELKVLVSIVVKKAICQEIARKPEVLYCLSCFSFAHRNCLESAFILCSLFI